MSIVEQTQHPWKMAWQGYCPTLEAKSLVRALFDDFVRPLHAAKASLILDGLGTLLYERGGGHSWHGGERGGERGGVVLGVSMVDAAVHAAEWRSSPELPTRERKRPHSRAMTITRGTVPVGTLEVEWERTPPDDATWTRHCQNFALVFAQFALRYDTRRWALEQFDQDLLFVGLSPHLFEVEIGLVRAAQTSLPVLLRGEYGTEFSTAALTLHRAGTQRGGPFVELHCAAIEPDGFANTVCNSFEVASGGTLFLHGLESMPIAAQRAFLHLLPSRLAQFVNSGRKLGPRLVSSTCADIGELVREGRLLRSLVSELDILSIRLPSLRERSEDMSHFVRYFLHKHGFDAHAKCTEDLMGVLTTYTWPGNLIELERALVQLSVMTGDAPISREDVEAHTPWLLDPPSDGDDDDDDDDDATSRDADPSGWSEPGPLSASASLEQWISAMVDEDVERFTNLHSGLRRALLYICAHYQERITLGQIAKQACLSTSHLSHLFKTTVGTNFKTLLARFRIEKAKELLAPTERPRRITDIAADSGFADLSHFEKTFRRFVDMCPSEYRSQFSGRVLM